MTTRIANRCFRGRLSFERCWSEGRRGTGVNVPVSGSTNAVENYTNLLNSLNSSTTNLVSAGGSLKFVAATSRSVSMAETFDTPLVIGYLAIDVPIVMQTNIVEGQISRVPAIGRATATQSKWTGVGQSDVSNSDAIDYAASWNSPTNLSNLATWLTNQTTVPRPGVWVPTAPRHKLRQAIKDLNIQQ